MVASELVGVPFLRRCRKLRIGGASGLRVIDAALRCTPEYVKKYWGATQFKQELQTMILEFFDSSDEAEFGRCVSELAPLSPAQSSELVRKLMALAMERSGTECEMALRLLVRLCHHEEIEKTAIEAGFNELYNRMPDIVLDVPDAREMALTFVVEAKKASLLRETWKEPDPSAEEQRDARGVTNFKHEVQMMLLEYFEAGDEGEVERCVSDLAPLSLEKSAEVVRKAMTLAMERTAKELAALPKLLVRLSRHKEVGKSGIEAGFDDFCKRLPDVLLDVPDAKSMLKTIVKEAKGAGALSKDWCEPE
jgi:hypothetical protein